MPTPIEYRESPLHPASQAGLVGVLLRVSWQSRFRISGFVVIFTAVGIGVALWKQLEFQSVARLIPEMHNGSGDMLKRLASVAGFANVDFSETDGIDAVRPDLYPNVLQSTPFILYLIEQPVVAIDGKGNTIGNLLHPVTDDKSWLKRIISLKPDVPVMPLKSRTAGTVHLSAWQQEVAEELSERVSAKLDTRSGIITITATMPDANVAATVAQLAMNYLTKYVTNYRTDKARKDLAFYHQHLIEARERYHKAQLSVFRYADNHKSVVMQATTMGRHRMEAELDIAQKVYTELAQEFEQAQLNVQARTPIFKVLEPPNVPSKQTSPKRVLLVLLFMVAGLVAGVLLVIAQQHDLLGQLKMIIS